MKYILLGVVVSVLVGVAVGMTDWNCVNDCLAKGYQYNYCTKICSY